MLQNDSYTEKVSKTHNFFMDRPLSSLSEAVFWTNRALQLKGRQPVFKRKGMWQSTIIYFYFFEIGILLSLLVLLTFFSKSEF